MKFHGQDTRKTGVRMSPRGMVIDAQFSEVGASAAPLTDAERAFLSSKMTATVDAIKAALSAARYKVNTTPNVATQAVLYGLISFLPSFFAPASVPDEVKKNVLAGLNMLENRVNSDLMPKMQNVLNGSLEPDRWFAMAQTYVDGIKSMLDVLKEDTTAAALASVWGGIKNDMTNFVVKFKQGVEATFDYMPIIVGGAVIMGVWLIVERILPRRSFSGYTRRKRRLKLR